MGVPEKIQDSINNVLSGDTEAFEAIVSEFKGLVFHIVRNMLSDQKQHKDLAQDIFLRVYESLRQFQFRCRLATWISRIAYNTCLNYLRRLKSHPQDSYDYRIELDRIDEMEWIDRQNLTSLDSISPHATTCHRELVGAVEKAIAGLPGPYRLVVTLHYLEGFALPELAQTLGIPLGTIKSHLFRARAMLKHDLLQKFTIEDLIE